ncbi:hypothetical protein A2774_01420 [Candidatus Roizmanbacteria bacterium RIFCSPHIGHO2_01_FULL_39_12c]|uniref:Uncharacterized protein n=1 Tax=Candidatus Roizmanbacteria bacterium RIFCSPHIGHO2_01_FULL_39_12c TaxID=1802031 RepID=A0A1F7G859_9BACT|nr:MAG: hypothetical protein A2774_01420 [Candidatus Roizmanbacteria bacterium RIFCSPHIGHO2_01_FULL_39_12c]OGK46566.1 MAG: hypothetical protein A2963_02430 [Candidatus Roizmanbacteria bacterium RIFCSPLOWO2_01_FULL_40_13]
MDHTEQLENESVDAAVNFDWLSAIEANKKILKIDSKNLSACLRLGFAFTQIQDFIKAVKYYRKALRIQPSNNIAKENLERLNVLQSKSAKNKKKQPVNLDPDLFLESPGRTKSISLVNIGQKNILANLNTGQEVFFRVKARKIEVRTKENEYIGNLPDDLSRRLLVFLKAKSKYKVYIKEANLSKVTVFIHEEKKGKKVDQYLSFPQNIQAQIGQMINDGEEEEDTAEVETEADLEKLAESLTSEEKEYLPYKPEEEDEEEE